MNLLM